MFSQEAVDNMREASLQMGFKAGVTAEQERIIKLLEEHAEQEFADNYARDDGTYHEDVCNLCAKWNGLGVAIALIKGENK